MYPGVKITIAGEDFIVPALSLKQLRNGTLSLMQEHDILIADGKTFEAMSIRADIILQALRRNYPDFEEDKLMSYLDMANSGPIWLSVLGVSGFTPGETQAATVAIPGT